MLLKVQPLMKWLSTFYMFLDSLDSLMWLKTRVIGKGFVTSLTFVRFFSRMDSEVDLKVWQCVIEVATFPTLWIIWCLHVTSKFLSFPLHLFPGWILRLWLMLERKCSTQSLRLQSSSLVCPLLHLFRFVDSTQASLWLQNAQNAQLLCFPVISLVL